MEIKCNREYCLSSTDVRDINNKEMRQMFELRERIDFIIRSHNDNKEKKEYINDDELKMMSAILHVFTKEYECTQTSEFDKMFELLESGKESESTEQATSC